MPWFLIRVAVGVVAGVVLYVYMNRRNNNNNHRGNYGSNISNRSSRFERDDSKICTICLGGYTLRTPEFVLPCKHKFHKLCISSVFGRGDSSSCPLCRKPVARDFITSNGLTNVSPSDENFNESLEEILGL